VVLDDLHVRPVPPLRLLEVADRGELTLAEDDSVARRLELEAREHHRLGDRDVLVHRDRAGRRPDDPREPVADRHRCLPPALLPGPHAALAPLARVASQALLGADRHRAERVVDQVGRVLEDREAIAVALARLHGFSVPHAQRWVAAAPAEAAAWSRPARPPPDASPSTLRSRRPGSPAA